MNKDNKEKQGNRKETGTDNVQRNKRKIYAMARIAVMTAVICALAPWSIPIGPVPISFTNLAIFLSLYVLGWKKGTVSLVLYLLLGMAGMPVFSGFSGGMSKLLGPTGGYIIGFLPMAMIAGPVVEQFNNRLLQFSTMLAGTAVCYGFGTAWFCVTMDTTVSAALSTCVFPFIPGDIAKMLVAVTVGPVLRKRLSKAGL